MEDKYFNEFFDKLYNGKLNIYEDEEDVNIYEGTSSDTNFNRFLKHVHIALDPTKLSKITRETKYKLINSLRNIINDEELTNVNAYANKNNRKVIIDKFNDWCKDNTGDCGKLKEMFPVKDNFNDFLRDVKIALNGYEGKTSDDKSKIKNSLTYIIKGVMLTKKVYAYANEKNREEFIDKFNDWCKDNEQKCEELKKILNQEAEDIKIFNYFEEFLKDLKDGLTNKLNDSRQRKYSLINIIKNGQNSDVKQYAKGEYRKEIKKMFNDWCKENKENTDDCKEIKEIVNEWGKKSNFEKFLIDVCDVLKNPTFDNYTLSKDNLDKIKRSLRVIINVENNLSSVKTYANENNRKETIKKYNDWCEKNTGDCENIKKIVNEWQIEEWRRYEESFAKKYGGTQYFKNLNKAERDFKESKIHKLRGVISIKEKISELTKDCRENNLCDITRKEQVKKRITNVVRNNIKTFLEHKETKVKKFDLECLVPIGDVIKKGFKIEVKMKTMLDGVFATYLTSPLKIRETDTIKLDDFGRQIYNEFVDDLLTSNEDNFIFERIIDDNCLHFDGIILDDDIFVPKEYITLYISSKNEYHKKNKVFTLRYNIDKSEKDNFYKIEKPRDNEPLKIRKLNSEEKSKLNGWYSDFTDKIYEKGKCKSGQSVNESYDSYLDQLVENFFNTGKLNIYEDEEDVNINEINIKTPEQNFNDFLRDVENVLNGKLTKYLKNSLRNIINDEELTNTFVYANKNNREETKKKYNDWCEKNTDKCKKLKEMVIERDWGVFLEHVNEALEHYPDEKKLKKAIKFSINAIINPDVGYEDISVHSYAYKKNRKETIKKFNQINVKN
jgi:hypothetical protein